MAIQCGFVESVQYLCQPNEAIVKNCQATTTNLVPLFKEKVNQFVQTSTKMQKVAAFLLVVGLIAIAARITRVAAKKFKTFVEEQKMLKSEILNQQKKVDEGFNSH